MSISRRTVIWLRTELFIVFLMLCIANGVQAQRAGPDAAFAPLTLHPAPSQTRLATGAPGPKYWQNRADYDLHATLDTIAGTLYGAMTLRYTNHSPDTLPVLWLQTEQNAFRLPSTNSDTAPGYGDLIDSCTETIDGAEVPLPLDAHETETQVTLVRPLRPGGTANVSNNTWKKIP